MQHSGFPLKCDVKPVELSKYYISKGRKNPNGADICNTGATMPRVEWLLRCLCIHLGKCPVRCVFKSFNQITKGAGDVE